MKRLPIISFLLLCQVVLSGLAAPAQAGPTVFVSIVPQKYFVERIKGGPAEVEVMVLHGASPASYEPKRSQMRKPAEDWLHNLRSFAQQLKKVL